MMETMPALVEVGASGDHVAVVTLRRPEARNAINLALAKELEAAVARVESDPAVRVAVITGEGGQAFCAGADLKEVAQGGLPALFTRGGGFAGFVNAQRAKPWIAAVDGVALAGGFEIALACDLIVASEDARFGLPEVTRGLIASAGGLYRLPRVVPKAIALEMIATGRPITAARASELGLVNRVVAKDEVLPTALDLAAVIAGCAPLAVVESLAIARRATWFEDGELRAAGDEAQDKLSATADYVEGARAFVEKRPARWRGR